MTCLNRVAAFVVLGMRIACGYSHSDNWDADDSFNENYNDEGETVSKLWPWNPEVALTRIRRYENNNDDRGKKAADMEDVRGALKEILSGRNVEEIFRNQDTTEMTDTSPPSSTLDQTKDTTPTNIATSSTVQEIVENGTYVEETQTENVTLETKREHATSIADLTVGTSIVRTYKKNKSKLKDFGPLLLRAGSTTPNSTTTNTTTETPRNQRLDIPALLDIISNFSYDWLDNLTMQVNATLQRKGMPTCSVPPGQEGYGENMTGTIMSKCFVCGLVEKEIPRNAHCADAFAGDFLPLVPVDPTARSQIGSFRKYCRYSNTAKQYINATDPKAVWARWTGGCAVRWIDLTGVYTQRVCRIRHKPVLGKNFASKRMAKLEMALQHVDNGCIISPMASLIPLSRAISLYARFHACVCTGPWCNGAIANQQCTGYIAIQSIFFIVRSIDFMII